MDEVTGHVDATPHEVWEVVSDVTRYGELSPECTGGRWTGGATVPVVGATFVGINRHGPVRWSTHCQVVAAEPGEHFSFRVTESAMRWGYRLAPGADGGTDVTEYRLALAPSPWYSRLVVASGVLGRHREDTMREGMRRSLAALARAVAHRSVPSRPAPRP